MVAVLQAATSRSDNQANPTTSTIFSMPMLWNGSTWDRQRSNTAPINTDTSSARSTSGNGNPFTNYCGREVVVFINVTAVAGTSPTATFRLQESYDGSLYRDVDTTNAQTTSITAATIAKLSVGPGLPNTAGASCNAPALRLLRLAWTLGGTSPSFTFATYFHASV